VSTNGSAASSQQGPPEGSACLSEALRLIDNRLDDQTLAGHLNRMLSSATAADIHVAYLRASGVALVRGALEALVGRRGCVRVLAGGDFAQTEPDALRYLRGLGDTCEVKLVSSSGLGGFHPKCYLIYNGERASLVVGSSNFTDGGLQHNIELNLHADLPAADPTVAAAQRIFDNKLWRPDQPLRVVLIGTDFEVRVWETLMRIPMGRATTYSDIAGSIGKPKAPRAVGAAVGKNPLSFVVPCHRVMGKSGDLTGYHWGLTRKCAMLGWEAGKVAA